MRIHKATRKYERWLAKHCEVVRADLERKHVVMRTSPFMFLRATYYRWAQQWPLVCPRLAEAPLVPSVGDLHVENFGTWRDAEGRLIWGINDFDEATPLAYTNDLVRLATSALLAVREARLALPIEDICRLILRGYRRSLRLGGRPFVQNGLHHWLFRAATAAQKPPEDFWATLAHLPAAPRALADRARRVLAADMPSSRVELKFKRRVAGAGSLGRPRAVALTSWRGGPIAREAKATLPSAVLWARGRGQSKIYAETILRQSVRSPDPTLSVTREWTVRRLAPDCIKIDLADLPRDHDERRLLICMGAELANVHLGDMKAARRAAAHLSRQSGPWLLRAALAMSVSVNHDWREFRRRPRS
jgi:hypothetical protein